MSYTWKCTCDDWTPETDKINTPILLAQARQPHLTRTDAFQFKAWAYCPWCGQRLAVSAYATVPSFGGPATPREAEP